MSITICKNRSFLVCLALAIVTISIFYEVYTFEFINYDDPTYVYGNPNIQQGITLKAVKWAFTSGYASNWHPLTWLSHMLDWQLFGNNPAGHHLINLFFHIANTLLLFLVLKQMTNTLWQSAFAAALFALHPLHVESVAWVAERKDVLSGLFWMLTMLTYLRYVKQPNYFRYILVLLTFALGLMTKPMLVTLPFILLLLDYWPLERIPLRQTTKKNIDKEYRQCRSFRWLYYRPILEKLPFLALSVVSGVVTFLVQRTTGATTMIKNQPFGLRISNALVSYVTYIVKMFYPTRLAVLYPYPVKELPVWLPLLCLLIIVTILILTIYAARRRRYLLVGWLWYLGTLVPVIGLVQVGAQAMADRYTYLPSIGIFIMVTWGAIDIFKSLRLPKAILVISTVIIITVLTLCTRMQLSYWRDNISLFGRAVEVTKDNYVMLNNYGSALRNEGRFNEAAGHFEQSIISNPQYVRAYVNLGSVYFIENKTSKAVTNWNKALKIDPDNVDALNNLAWLRAVYTNSEFYNPELAVRLALRACKKSGDNKPYILDTLAAAYAASGDYNKAVETAEKAIDLCTSSLQEEVKDQITKRLALYKKGKPYTEAHP